MLRGFVPKGGMKVIWLNTQAPTYSVTTYSTMLLCSRHFLYTNTTITEPWFSTQVLWKATKQGVLCPGPPTSKTSMFVMRRPDYNKEHSKALTQLKFIILAPPAVGLLSCFVKLFRESQGESIKWHFSYKFPLSNQVAPSRYNQHSLNGLKKAHIRSLS